MKNRLAAPIVWLALLAAAYAVPVEIHDATMHAIITETGAKMQN